MSERRGEGTTRAGALARRVGVALAALALLAAGAYLLRVPLLTAAGRWLVVEDAPRPAEAIYLLNGDSRWGSRARRAALLYRQGLGARVLLARSESPPSVALALYPNETDVSVAVLRAHGVPDSAVVVLEPHGGVTSTSDEALVLARHLGEHYHDRIWVVTSAHHSRRARWLLRRALPDSVELLVSAAPHPRFHAGNWWRSETGLIAVTNEYLKFLHNWIYR